MNRMLCYVLPVCTLTFVTACAHDSTPPITNMPPASTDATATAPPALAAAAPRSYDPATLTRAYNGFGVRLFTKLHAAQPAPAAGIRSAGSYSSARKGRT